MFLKTDIGEQMNFKKRSGAFHKNTMDGNPGNKLIEKLGGVVEWCMMDSEDKFHVSILNFKLKMET